MKRLFNNAKACVGTTVALRRPHDSFMFAPSKTSTIGIMTERDVIEADDVQQVVRSEAARASATAADAALPAGKPATLRDFKEWSERAFLVEKLREFGWNISKTADVIDTPRSNLYKKLEQYNIKQESDG